MFNFLTTEEKSWEDTHLVWTQQGVILIMCIVVLDYLSVKIKSTARSTIKVLHGTQTIQRERYQWSRYPDSNV